MKNINPFIAVMTALVLATPAISLAQATNISTQAVPVAPAAMQAAPVGASSVSAPNTTTTKTTTTTNTTINAAAKCGVNSFSVSNECGVGVFKNSYVQCYDGYIENQGGESSCKPSSLWQEYARNICAKRCAAATNTTAGSSVSGTGSSVEQNTPATSIKAVSPETPAAMATPQVISVCYIDDNLTKQYDAVLSELKAAQANGDQTRSDIATKKILELRQQISASKERCNAATTQSQSSTAVKPAPAISSATATAVAINRCDEVKQWQEKIAYYQNLNALSDEDLKNKSGFSRDAIKDTLAELGAGIERVREQCNLQTATGSASNALSQAIIAEPVKPVAVQSAQEINTYYKAKIENISNITDSSEQVKELQALKEEKSQMVGNLIKNRNEIEATEINQVAADISVSKNEVKVDNVTVEAIGKKILLNVGDRAVSVEPTEKQVLIKDKNLDVTADNVSISDNSLKIGNVEVKISASQAAEKLNIAPKAVQLTTENSQPVYKMEVNQARKLFGFIKINAETTQTVNADNGNLISEKRPWFYFLTTK
ncbi:MAG: hypothetical protein WC475_02910 [Candidatus Paceibacterota bacterium]